MSLQANLIPDHIVRRVGHQGTRYPVGDQAGNDKFVTGKPFNLRSTTRFGTWNVRKLKALGKLNNLYNEMDKNNIDVLGLSETNWNNNGSFQSSDRNKTVLFSGKVEGQYSHGVAVILSRAASSSLLGYVPISAGLSSYGSNPSLMI